MKASILTLGCKANQSESIEIESYLRSAGYRIVDLNESPEICIINTCTVTAKSDYQSRQLIKRAIKAGSKVYVTGCYSEINKDEVERLDGLFRIIPNDKKYLIIEELTSKNSINTLDFTSGRSRYFFKIQDGCNYSCSYCIIPKARGRSRSLDPELIIERIREVSHYYREVVLTGIHLGTYGYDFKPKLKLSQLIARILKETPIKRIRLSSLEIGEIDEQLLELLSDSRICQHLHIPLQSGDDNVLGRMKRNYRVKDFLKGIYKIIERYPGISIGTDVIVGFPGETNEEFNNTRQLIESLPFSYLHVFPYSVRSGTEATNLSPYVNDHIKKQRAAILRDVSSQKRLDYSKRQIGRTLDVLIERRIDGYYIGLSSNYLKIKTASHNLPLRDIVNIRISEIIDSELFGHPVVKL
mgnify:CR=1 FL=1